MTRKFTNRISALFLAIMVCCTCVGGNNVSATNYTENLNKEVAINIELPNKEISLWASLKNIMYMNANADNVHMGKSYDGQESGAYGYGGIVDIKKYLADRYGGTVSLSSQKVLSMNSCIMTDFAKNESNCTLTAITRIFKYYRDLGYKKIPQYTADIYKVVLANGKKYGYTPTKGTSPTKINNIVDATFDSFGYPNGYSNGIYVWSFSGNVKKEIDSGRPVIMNIARGYYGDHTVTVCGYKIYKTKKKVAGVTVTKTHNMIAVYDGWSRGIRYIDYEAFAYDLASSGFGSFNTVIMK